MNVGNIQIPSSYLQSTLNTFLMNQYFIILQTQLFPDHTYLRKKIIDSQLDFYLYLVIYKK